MVGKFLMGFLPSSLLCMPKASMLRSLGFKPLLLIASYLAVSNLLLSASLARPHTPTIVPSSHGGVLGLEHRDFSEDLNPNLSSAERLESAVRRSKARKDRIEGMVRKLKEIKLYRDGNRAKHNGMTRGNASAKREERDSTISASETKAKVEPNAAKIVGTNARMGEVSNARMSKRAKIEPDTAKIVGANARMGGVSSDRMSNNKGTRGYALEMERGDGAYLTTLYVGTPPRKARVIMDTGSDLVWQQCQPCEACFEQADQPIFDPALSSTFKKLRCSDALCEALLPSACMHSTNGSCQYTYMYGDTSFTAGELAYDTLTLLDALGQAHLKIDAFAFGCGYASRGASFTGSDGILGMGQGPLSLASQTSSPSFSYCLSSFSNNHLSPLLLGDHVPTFLHIDKSSPMEVTPILKNSFMPTFYYLNLTGISLDGVHLNISPKLFSLKANGSGGMIIDSGTTITYLEEHSYQVVLDAMQSKIRNPLQVPHPMFGLDLCFLPVNISTLPTLTLHFDGANMHLPASNLFFEVVGIYCFALGRSHDISILGNMQQQNYQMLYDNRKQQLSFMHTSCDQL